MFISIYLETGGIVVAMLVDDSDQFKYFDQAQTDFGSVAFDSSIKLTFNPSIWYSDFIFEYGDIPEDATAQFLAIPRASKLNII